MVIGGGKVVPGSDGWLIWRLGSDVANGPVRPLRRALQVRKSLELIDSPGLNARVSC